jgi:hypothetical protein
MHTAREEKRLPVFWISFIGSIVLVTLLIMFTKPDSQQVSTDPKQLPWNAHYDESGQLHALGLTLNKSSVADAMQIYGKDVEIKIFSKKDGSDKSLEAFFPVIYIGSIKAGLALRLQADIETLNSYYNKGKKTVPTRTGDREVELYYADAAKLLNHPIISATLVPRKNLTDRAIAMRFGEPDRKETQSDGLDHWFYNKLGLELIIDAEGPEALQYSANY